VSNLDKLDESGFEILESIAAEYQRRCLAGEEPDVEEYVDRYPQLAEEIRDTLPALAKLSDLTPHQDSRGPSAQATEIPESIGDYRIVSELGRGGMGVVYLAVQESLDRTVALKVLPGSALLGERSRERFRREAQIAAQLHHTNIVPVYGTGEADGVHYYAMQYIEGESLDRVIHALRKLEPDLDPSGNYHSKHPSHDDRSVVVAEELLKGRLGDAEDSDGDNGLGAMSAAGSSPNVPRNYATCVARIGTQVAQALAHAHVHGVLHRDIKPSNLILDQDGTIWITDFGLARFEEQASLTSTGDLVGTLRYMSPERLKGQQIDARTDVYALGLTLYELLTFRAAQDEQDRGRLIKNILETEPDSPSSLMRWIPRDLETIVLKAIAKEPESRYASAQALAADLDRFLAGRAVTARPIGPLGRAWRWCRRNRVVSGLAASLLLVLATGLAVVTWQWRRAEGNLKLAKQLQARAETNLAEANAQRDRAEVNFLRARKAVDDYLVTVSENALLEVPTLEPVRAELLERARSFYESFVEERIDDPQIRAELAASYIRLGQIEHDLGGDWLPMLTRGLEMVEELHAQGVSFADFPSWRAGIYNSRSGYLRTSDVEKFRPLVDRAVALWEPLVEEHPDVHGFRTDLAGLYQMRGMVHFNVGEYDEAYADFQRSLELREPLVEQFPDDEKYRYALGESYTTCGMVKIRTEQFDEALGFSTKAKELLEPIAEANPSATRLADILAAIHQWVALAHLRKNNAIQALSSYQKALEIQERLSREYPYEPHFQLNLAMSYRMLGQSMFEAGQATSAMSTFDKCFALLNQRLEDYPEKTEYRGALASAYLDLNRQLYRRKEYEDALQAARDALSWTDEETSEQRAQRSVVHFRIGQSLEATGEYEGAQKSYSEAIAVARSAETLPPGWLATYLDASARTLSRLDRYEEAERTIHEYLSLRLAQENQSAPLIARGYLSRGRMLEKLARFEDACADLRHAIEYAHQADEVEATYAREAVNRLVNLLRQAGKTDAAEDLLAKVRQRSKTEYGALFTADWTVAVLELDEEQLAEFKPEADWDPLFTEGPIATLSRDALDLVWHTEPFADGVPTKRFAIVATCDWDFGAQDVELHVHYGDLIRVYIDSELAIEGVSEKDARMQNVSIPAKEGTVAIRVVHIQRRAGRSRLRVWVTPSTEATGDSASG